MDRSMGGGKAHQDFSQLLLIQLRLGYTNDLELAEDLGAVAKVFHFLKEQSDSGAALAQLNFDCQDHYIDLNRIFCTLRTFADIAKKPKIRKQEVQLLRLRLNSVILAMQLAYTRAVNNEHFS